jgi:hypothetical protein
VIFQQFHWLGEVALDHFGEVILQLFELRFRTLLLGNADDVSQHLDN